MKLVNPIIIIGAGRSGTSLLTAVMDAHPSIYMLGETDLVIPKFWHIFSTPPAVVSMRQAKIRQEALRRFAASGSNSDDYYLSIVADVKAKVEEDERIRLGEITLSSIDKVFDLSNKTESFWGFKDPWLGSDSAFQDWTCYDYTVPDALWVHIVRHPFDFARSRADWQNEKFTSDFLYAKLQEWVKNGIINRERRRTDRYVSLRYEDLITSPRNSILPILKQLDVPFHENCLKALKKQYVASRAHSPVPFFDKKSVLQIPKLADLMADYFYEIPDPGSWSDNDSNENLGNRAVIMPLATVAGKGEWILNAPFIHEDNFCWHVDLHRDGEFSSLDSVADELHYPRRSTLVLFEDGNPLGPAHSLHRRIREEGRGAYSHWRNIGLLFSTSDNTDPNTNGKAYSIKVSFVSK